MGRVFWQSPASPPCAQTFWCLRPWSLSCLDLLSAEHLQKAALILIGRHVSSFTGSFPPLVPSLNYGIKQKSGICKQNSWSQRQTEERALKKTTPGQRLCSLPKEVENGRLLLQFTAVHADRQAIAGLPNTMKNRIEDSRKYFFWAYSFLENWRMVECKHQGP